MSAIKQPRLRRIRTRFLWACSVAATLGVANMALADSAPPEALPTNPPAAAPAQQIPIYGLNDCIAIAFQKQPAIAAARASLNAKVIIRNNLVNSSRFSRVFVPDIDVRKQQSCRGVNAAQAMVLQTEAETTYAVTRTYFTAIYARMQQDVASEVVDNLGFYRDLVAKIVKAGSDRDINQGTLDRLDIYLGLARSKKSEAEQGVQRALAALRESMGQGLECSSFQLADLRLPEPEVTPEKCDIVNLALSRRGELMQVLLAADVYRLEVDAQGRHFFKPSVHTFAAFSDIHAQPIPAGHHNGDYRPGALGLEMPSNIGGKRGTRMSVASAYSERADAVVAKTRELINLEAENGYLKWTEASHKLASARTSATTARRLAKQTREDANAGARVKEGEILSTDVLAGQANAAYYEAAFQQVLALADLERITAGGFNANLGGHSQK